MDHDRPGNGAHARAYRSAPGVVWLKDSVATLVVDRAAGRSWVLRGLEAATWDLLAVGYEFEPAARLLAVLGDVGESEARASLSTMLRDWEEMGILVAEKGNGCGQPGD